MNKDETQQAILSQLGAVINVLNSVSVSGRDNLTRLGGSICTLEQISEALKRMFELQNSEVK